MRLFLALEISDAAKAALSQTQSHIEKGAPGFYRWSTHDHMHLTLYFLGDMDESSKQSVTEAVGEVRSSAFRLRTEGLLFFPERTVPRVLAAGLTGDVAQLRSLQQRISDTVFSLAEFKEKRAFSPHVTLGRLRQGMPGNAKALKRTLDAATLRPSEPFVVNEFLLVQSEVSPDGSKYETLYRFPIA